MQARKDELKHYTAAWEEMMSEEHISFVGMAVQRNNIPGGEESEKMTHGCERTEKIGGASSSCEGEFGEIVKGL
jgi:hypothetical protein